MRGIFTDNLQDVVKDCLDSENAINYACDFIYKEKEWGEPWAGIKCKTITENYKNGVYVKYLWENEEELSLGIYFGENEVSEETRTKMYHYFIQKINTPDDFSNDSAYLSSHSEPISERQTAIPITLPDVIAKNDGGGDVYYRLEMQAEIGTGYITYSDTIDIPVRFISGI